jgi:hypothetical protein
MLSMRVLIAASALVLCVAGMTAARAADLPFDSAQTSRSYAIGQRSGPIIVYDYRPGVVVRAYWQSPWRNRHYYPRTGERPGVGRAEDLSAPREHYVPAATFYRAWSTMSLDTPVPPPIKAPVAKIPGPLK